jgi:tetratricopeptide (TPR) repeat protein
MLLSQYDKAIEAFQRYVTYLEQQSPPHEWKKEDAEVYWRLANCMEALNDSTYLPRIVENYKRAVQLDATDERSVGGLALAYHKVGRYAEAAVEFEKLVVAHPNDARHLFNAALPYMQLENNEKAVELLLRTAQDDTTSGQSYRERAYKLSAPRLIKMQRIADAQTAYKWLVDREPDVCDHYQWLGFTYFANRNYSAALPHLKRAYRCFEQLNGGGCKHNDLRWWLAYAQYEGGDKEAAYDLCEKVVECTPDHKDARDLMNRIDEETIEEN